MELARIKDKWRILGVGNVYPLYLNYIFWHDTCVTEDPVSGESIEVDVKAERYQSMDLVQPVTASDARETGASG